MPKTATPTYHCVTYAQNWVANSSATPDKYTCICHLIHLFLRTTWHHASLCFNGMIGIGIELTKVDFAAERVNLYWLLWMSAKFKPRYPSAQKNIIINVILPIKSVLILPHSQMFVQNIVFLTVQQRWAFNLYNDEIFLYKPWKSSYMSWLALSASFEYIYAMGLWPL